jgi:hypothetical protein
MSRFVNPFHYGWENAPELSAEVRNQVCQLVINSPEDYKKIHNVELKNGEIIEDWNFAIFAASPNKV